MKTVVKGLFAALLASLALTSQAGVMDRVVINGGGIYANSDVTFHAPVANAFIGGAPIFGNDGWGVLNIYLTEPGTNIISDHLYSVAGGTHACQGQGNGADCIFFSSDSTADASIGTMCTLGPNFCLQETGLLQDLTALVTAQNGGRGIFGGGSIQVQSADVPEPGTFALLGLGVMALGYSMRKRSARAGGRTALAA